MSIKRTRCAFVLDWCHVFLEPSLIQLQEDAAHLSKLGSDTDDAEMQEHETINIPSEDEVLSAHEQLDVAPLISENAAALALKSAENGGHLADDLGSEPGSTKLEIIENNNSDRLAFEDIMDKMRIFVFSVFFPNRNTSLRLRPSSKSAKTSFSSSM
ncbi:hypothetical protein BFJ69_g860 [Fusarium oxysporum]|uniref:Uncharacterized protein n=1 Tax=Fusarium oxysporum TaxID=5507 RepID=A0A420P278_FUSOX|nr:hypothetical protein BFJ69_g860 [Fusarium oxysporum]